MKLSHLVLFIVLFLAGCACCAPSVHAEIFRWQDPNTGLQTNYPDTWGRIHNQKPDDLLTVTAPSPTDHATCRLRVRDDNRFAITPVSHAGAIQKTEFLGKFWNRYLNEYDDVTLHGIREDGALGRGYASYIEASYTPTIGPKATKRALIGATLYYNKVYIYECSSTESTFHRWSPAFTQILKSITFPKILHGHPNGEYRWFTGDDTTLIKHTGPHPADLYAQ